MIFITKKFFEERKMDIFDIINLIIGAAFFIFYSYQFFYIPAAFFLKEPKHMEEKSHRFAVLICARNEEDVIAQLIESIKNQTYERSKIRIFVMADNCTDSTARVARNSGAKVYIRNDSKRKGKGFALEALFSHISEDYPRNYFDGFFVFDADNILDRRYIEEMNRSFCDGFEIITGYRNSKNYGENWISAGYSLWFLRESRFLNEARFLLGNSCAVSGTGFFFSRRIAEKFGGWPFHLLTEDIEFTAAAVLSNEKIGYCKNAVLYDEQPVLFSQSWNQRLRWAKGYLQVFEKHGKNLLKKAAEGDFSAFDMASAIMPAAALTALSVVVNTFRVIVAVAIGESILPGVFAFGESLLGIYSTMFFIGFVTLLSEWKKIRAKTFEKIFYLFTFPVFMMTYLPVSAAAVFMKVEWKPIKHKAASDAEKFRFEEEKDERKKKFA